MKKDEEIQQKPTEIHQAGKQGVNRAASPGLGPRQREKWVRSGDHYTGLTWFKWWILRNLLLTRAGRGC